MKQTIYTKNSKPDLVALQKKWQAFKNSSASVWLRLTGLNWDYGVNLLENQYNYTQTFKRSEIFKRNSNGIAFRLFAKLSGKYDIKTFSDELVYYKHLKKTTDVFMFPHWVDSALKNNYVYGLDYEADQANLVFASLYEKMESLIEEKFIFHYIGLSEQNAFEIVYDYEN
jgi:hypothetical protein